MRIFTHCPHSCLGTFVNKERFSVVPRYNLRTIGRYLYPTDILNSSALSPLVPLSFFLGIDPNFWIVLYNSFVSYYYEIIHFILVLCWFFNCFYPCIFLHLFLSFCYIICMHCQDKSFMCVDYNIIFIVKNIFYCQCCE